MSRIDGGDFGWAADEARRLADQAQLDQQRQADLERARVLAATMPAALDPGNTRGPEDLGRILAEVQRMTAEARLGFGSDVARLSAAATPPRDPGALTAALIDEACPRGSGRRRRLGETLVASFGANPTGVPPRVLEAAVTQALASLTAPATPRGSQRRRLARVLGSRKVDEEGRLSNFGLPCQGTSPELAKKL